METKEKNLKSSPPALGTFPKLAKAGLGVGYTR
jgi:hypothetical protein